MTANTIDANRRNHRLARGQTVWLFGYGSLIFKPDFPYLDRQPAHIRHWTRRFWQGSHDHRGTELSPGRVVTLIPEQGSMCRGVAYLISEQVFDHLDHREKNGYLRFDVDVVFDDGGGAAALVYIATEDNAAFLGSAPDIDIARQIAASAGPSGRNADYVTELAAALRQLGAEDAHVFGIERLLEALV